MILYLIVFLTAVSITVVIITPMLSEIETDYADHKKGIKDKKFLDVLVFRGGLLLLAAALTAFYRLHVWSTTDSYILNVAICWVYGVGVYTLFFNILFNRKINKPWYFLGTTSDMDVFLTKYNINKYVILSAQILVFLTTLVLFIVI